MKFPRPPFLFQLCAGCGIFSAKKEVENWVAEKVPGLKTFLLIRRVQGTPRPLLPPV